MLPYTLGGVKVFIMFPFALYPRLKGGEAPGHFAPARFAYC